MFISSNAAPMDAFGAGVKLEGFEYRFLQASLIAQTENGLNYSSFSDIPAKYLVMHRLAIKPTWGEIAFWESITYYNRFEIGYLNPLIFLKSEEHVLHDRDNSMLGGDFTIRILSCLQVKGSYLLDDIISSEIGKNFWANKAAMNVDATVSLPCGLDLGAEYSRIEPYTFSHFNLQNSYTNDSATIGGYMAPNSDEFALLGRYLFGARYPIEIKIAYQRHGANIYDANDSLIFNAGADPFISRRTQDPERIRFLAGERQDYFIAQASAGLELWRGFNLKLTYYAKCYKSEWINFFRIKFSFEDF
jgi:hypothetical protein